MTGHVICPLCSARIRADRPFCLRCGEPLRIARRPVRPPQPRPWFADPGTLFAGVVGLLGLLIAVAAWRFSPVGSQDDIARPAPEATRPTTAVARERKSPDATDAADAAPSMPVEIASVNFVDATRTGGAAFAGGDFESAKTHYEAAVARRPDDAEATNSLGLALERLGQVDAAIERYERAIELAPAKWAYHFNLAHALGRNERWDEAIAEYREAATLFPQDYAIRYNLALALHKRADDQAAIPEYQHAIRLAPGESSFYLSLAISLEKVGRLADAQATYRQYLEMEPGSADAARLKAHLQALGPPTSPAPAKPSGL